MSDIVISGISVLSSIGLSVEETLSSFRQGKSGICKTPVVDKDFLSKFPFGRIKLSDEKLIELCGNYETKGLTRTDALAKVAFQKAVADAGLSEDQIKSRRTAFISASTVGGMSNTMQLYRDATENKVASEYIGSYSSNAHLIKLVNHHGIIGPTSVINTACSSSANAIMLGAKLLKQNKVDIAIVGGVDCLSEFTIRGFNALGILSDEVCQPFDTKRKGLNLGEGAAYIVLRKSDNPILEKSYGVVAGWANSSDSFHSSALNEDGSGVANCIRQAINCAGIQNNQVDFVNAHGTGTMNNDLAEMTAISQLFKPAVPVYSTKSYTGHTLGAAGVLEAVFTLIALTNQEVYPSLNISSPLVINQKYKANINFKKADLKYALSNSFGFNGNCTSLILSVNK
jgi:3-oxoacyl-(acyl-carrier-protein) synthase